MASTMSSHRVMAASVAERLSAAGTANALELRGVTRMFGALADATRRDIVRRAIDGEQGILELAGHYPMSFAAVQKHVAILERAGLVTKERIGRRKVVRANLEGVQVVRRLLEQYEALWRGRIDRMADLLATETAAETSTAQWNKETDR